MSIFLMINLIRYSNNQFSLHLNISSKNYSRDLSKICKLHKIVLLLLDFCSTRKTVFNMDWVGFSCFCFLLFCFHSLSSFGLLCPVVRKPIYLIQDKCQLFFHIFSFLVKASFAYTCFSKSTSSDVKFCRIPALKNTLELRNKLLG